MKLFPYSLIALVILAVTLSGCDSGNSGGTTYTPGQSSAYTVGNVTFNVRYVPAVSNFPTGANDSGTGSVSAAYWMAETEVTYKLWNEVKTQMTVAYNFTNIGVQGDGSGDTIDHPVTTITWYNAVVWCNALTEYYNLKNGTNLGCVYKSGGIPIRNATVTATLDTVEPDATAKGFRLPTGAEWELAARYRRNDSVNAILRNGIYYTKGDSASGATANYGNETVTGTVAWYVGNSLSTLHAVAGRTANALGLYDMSGNVWEWCFDRDPGSSLNRVVRGGSWMELAVCLQVGDMSYGYIDRLTYDVIHGFRPVRTE